MPARKEIPTLEELKAMALITADCWLWQFSIDGKGYGVIRRGMKLFKVHRLVWQLVHGDIPSDSMICHRCDVKKCYNPKHLYLGDAVTNAIDYNKQGNFHKDKLFCPAGHEYTEENTRYSANGWRECKICRRETTRRYRRRQWRDTNA